MTFQQYKNLSKEQQMYTLKYNAVMVASLRRNNEVYTLFQVYGFYIEVFSYETVEPMSSINCFEETELLEPYLKSINISSIYKVLNQKNWHMKSGKP